jgi:plasmid stabilization system protein ParE
MKNTYDIIWSKRAYNNLSEIIAYLEENWTEKEIQRMSSKLDRCLNIIENNPEAFPSSNTKPGLRRVVITKQNILYYRTEGSLVILVNIFDARQNPKKK